VTPRNGGIERRDTTAARKKKVWRKKKRRQQKETKGERNAEKTRSLTGGRFRGPKKRENGACWVKRLGAHCGKEQRECKKV